MLALATYVRTTYVYELRTLHLEVTNAVQKKILPSHIQ